MFEAFSKSTPEPLERPQYKEDFSRRFAGDIRYTKKLERGQNFKERGFASWEALAAGEWDRALELIEEYRDAQTEYFAEVALRNIVHHRIRVVEFPVTPYVQWELHVLRLRAELGERVRVADARKISAIEKDGPVPELLIVGDSAMYEVIYDGGGNAAGAHRFTDAALIEETTAEFDSLYEQAEDFSEFFDREISPLPPPPVAGLDLS